MSKRKTLNAQECASLLTHAIKDAVNLTLDDHLKNAGLQWRDIEALSIDVTKDAIDAIAGTYTGIGYNLVAVVDKNKEQLPVVNVPDGQVLTGDDIKKAIEAIDAAFNEVDNDG